MQIAALGDAHIQPLLQPGEMLLMRAAQGGQQLVVGEFQRDLFADRLFRLAFFTPARFQRAPMQAVGGERVDRTLRIVPIRSPRPATCTG